MVIKTENEIFLFVHGGFSHLPNQTTDTTAAVVTKRDNDDYSNLKVVEGRAVLKTDEDFIVEKNTTAIELDAQHKHERQTALMSFELTIFPDTTLSTQQQNEIKRVRQEWLDMTLQTNYPHDFVKPELNPALF